jgi:transcriptional regulator with XRE-family HTH domain
MEDALVSSDLFIRLKKIQDYTGLSIKEFGERISVPDNTLRTMWRRESTPKGEILERVAIEWPEYAMWLITGKDRYMPTPKSFYENATYFHAFDIVDIIDARFMDTPISLDEIIIKPSQFLKLIMIQSDENENDLGALLLIDQDGDVRKNPRIRALWVQAGNINFASQHGGKLALKIFRDWLRKNCPDLMEKAILRSCNALAMGEIHKSKQLSEAFTNEIDEKIGTNKLLKESFNKWKQGEKDW